MMTVALCAALAACADRYVTNPEAKTSGNWKIETQVDRITGVPVPSAMMIIDNASNSFDNYTKPASMQLT